MTSKLSIILGSICGAFLIQCSSGASLSLDGHVAGDGFVGSADAADSCVPVAETFTKLAEGDLNASSSQPIAVAGYHSVVVYVTSQACGNSYTYVLAARFRVDSASPFGGTGQGVPVNEEFNRNPPGARIRVDGSDLELRHSFACAVHYVVAGVK